LAYLIQPKQPEHAVDNERPDRLCKINTELANSDLKLGHGSTSAAISLACVLNA